MNEYTSLLKWHIKKAFHIHQYLHEAIKYYKNPDTLVSGVDKAITPTFLVLDQDTNHWITYKFILNEPLTKFDLYKVYDHEKRQVGTVPVNEVMSTSELLKYKFPNVKPKAVQHKSTKLNTSKHPKSKASKPAKHRKSKSVSKKGSKARSKGNKK